MVVRLWGVRGSLPTPLSTQEVKQKILFALTGASNPDIADGDAAKRYVESLPLHIKGSYGGNTSCVELQSGDSAIIFDAGSGIRPLGAHLMKGKFSKGRGTAYIFLSHTHWDHIQGFPFFLPAYVSGNRIIIYSPYPDIEQRVKSQQLYSYFPVSIEAMEAGIEFLPLSEGETVTIEGISISNIKLKHPGDSFGYRVEKKGRSFVYATDMALNNLSGSELKKFIAFVSHAKVAVFDAQYRTNEVLSKKDWGHSSPRMAIDVAIQANVETVVLFHHDPAHDDYTLYKKFQAALDYLSSKGQHNTCKVIMAYEGLQLTV